MLSMQITMRLGSSIGEVHGSSILLFTGQISDLSYGKHEKHTEPSKPNKQANIGLDERPVQQSELLFWGRRELRSLG